MYWLPGSNLNISPSKVSQRDVIKGLYQDGSSLLMGIRLPETWEHYSSQQKGQSV